MPVPEPRPVFDELVDRDTREQAADDAWSAWCQLIEQTTDRTDGAVCWMPDEHELGPGF